MADNPKSRRSPELERQEWYLWTEDDVRLYVTEYGQAEAGNPTVIVLHGGWGAEHSYLLDAVRPLAHKYHFVLYDQRGSLRSPAPEDQITYERMVADLDELRGELGLEQVILLGHSMGTFLSYMYLDEYSDCVQGLVLTGPVGPLEFPKEAEAIGVDISVVQKAREQWKSTAEIHISTKLEEEGLDRDDLSSKERTHKWRISFAGHNIFNIDRWQQMKGGQVFYNGDVGRALQANAKTDDSAIASRMSHALKTFDRPIRIILGDFDLTDPGAQVWPQYAEHIPSAQLRVLEEAGHLAWIDRPAAFREALDRALERATK